MIKVREFENKFDSQKDALKAILLKQNELIDLKKSTIYESRQKKGLSLNHLKSENALKSSVDWAKDMYIYPIISSTKFYDSHGDVHFDGCFSKTIKEQHGKIKYILDHQLTYDNILAWQKDVNMIVRSIDWAIVGKNYEGQTEALIFEIEKSKIRRKDVLSDIENKVEEFENSIRMVYHKIKLGVKTDDKEYKENREYYERKISEIVNADEVEENGYFWGVEELGIYKEGSLVVAGGSNSATSIYQNNIYEPLQNTHKHEPSNDTQMIDYIKSKKFI